MHVLKGLFDKCSLFTLVLTDVNDKWRCAGWVSVTIHVYYMKKRCNESKCWLDFSFFKSWNNTWVNYTIFVFGRTITLILLIKKNILNFHGSSLTAANFFLWAPADWLRIWTRVARAKHCGTDTNSNALLLQATQSTRVPINLPLY